MLAGIHVLGNGDFIKKGTKITPTVHKWIQKAEKQSENVISLLFSFKKFKFCTLIFSKMKARSIYRTIDKLFLFFKVSSLNLANFEP